MDVTPLYSHLSATITVHESEQSVSEPDPKKAKKERLCPKDVEGYVIILAIKHLRTPALIIVLTL